MERTINMHHGKSHLIAAQTLGSTETCLFAAYSAWNGTAPPVLLSVPQVGLDCLSIWTVIDFFVLSLNGEPPGAVRDRSPGHSRCHST